MKMEKDEYFPAHPREQHKIKKFLREFLIRSKS